jgi:hypothetical protein
MAEQRTFRAVDESLVTVFLSDVATVALLKTGLVLVEPGDDEEEEEPMPNYERTPTIAGLSIPAHDYVVNTYTGANLTQVVYKKGGAAGEIVATLTMAYDGDKLTSVTREPTLDDLED